MGTATLVEGDLGGHPGPARLYRIDPPMAGADHIVIYTRPPAYGQQGQVVVVLADDTGAVLGRDVRPQAGTHVSPNPSHTLALQLAGYEVAA